MEDLISREKAIEEIKAVFEWHDTVTMERMIEHFNNLPSAQPEPCGDVVSRNAIVQKLNEMDRYVSTELRLCDTDKKFPQNEVFIVDDVYEEIVEQLPSAQPETHEERTETHACDLISRQSVLKAINNMVKECDSVYVTSALRNLEVIVADVPSAQPEHTNSCYTNSWCVNCKEYDTENKCCPRYNRVIKQTLDDAYRHGETEAEARYHAQQRWIPCSDCERRCDKWEHSKTSRE